MTRPLRRLAEALALLAALLLGLWMRKGGRRFRGW